MTESDETITIVKPDESPSYVTIRKTNGGLMFAVNLDLARVYMSGAGESTLLITVEQNKDNA